MPTMRIGTQNKQQTNTSQLIQSHMHCMIVNILLYSFQVVFYTYDGPFPATKIILRCSRCNLNYHPDIFGNSTEGYRYYEEQQRFVKCTQQAFMDRRLHSMVIAAGYVFHLV